MGLVEVRGMLPVLCCPNSRTTRPFQTSVRSVETSRGEWSFDLIVGGRDYKVKSYVTSISSAQGAALYFR